MDTWIQCRKISSAAPWYKFLEINNLNISVNNSTIEEGNVVNHLFLIRRSKTNVSLHYESQGEIPWKVEDRSDDTSLFFFFVPHLQTRLGVERFRSVLASAAEVDNLKRRVVPAAAIGPLPVG